MSQLSYDDEDYYFQISDELESDKEFVLIIYDIVDNRKRVKLAKLLSGYGKRVQKSAFEAMLTTQRYNKLIEEIPRYMVKHQVRPGLTGWAQVNGYRGDTSIRKRIECDLYYIENWSIGLDIKIIFLTFFKGFINKNAY